MIPYGSAPTLPSAEKETIKKPKKEKKYKASTKKALSKTSATASKLRVESGSIKDTGKKKKKPNRKLGGRTALKEFKLQTLAKKKELQKARSDIDRELKAIEKDLGVLKRK